MKKGKSGTIHLNAELRNVFNPPSTSKNETKVGNLKFRVGEKVIQTKNRKEIKNGDVGNITAIAKGKITVMYPNNRKVEYSEKDADELLPAWAISVHRSQGSDYPVAVIPMFDESQIMLNKNLLYTGVTRGKKLVIIIGQKNVIKLAAETDGVRRMTTLRQRLALAA
jgi:exodeoxyribonuclease V alpha subunit